MVQLRLIFFKNNYHSFSLLIISFLLSLTSFYQISILHLYIALLYEYINYTYDETNGTNNEKCCNMKPFYVIKLSPTKKEEEERIDICSWLDTGFQGVTQRSWIFEELKHWSRWILFLWEQFFRINGKK